MTTALQQNPPAGLHGLLEKSRQAETLRREQGIDHTPAAMREALAAMTQQFVTQPVAVDAVEDLQVDGVPVRVYRPDAEADPAVLVFAHGGGHMAGSVAVYDGIARRLARAARRILVSVEYRLAPEHPYPDGLSDLQAVVRGVLGMLRAAGIAHRPVLALAGDSGGGAITASAVHRLADETGIDIAQQVLIYPSLDYTLSQPSVESLASGYLLERERIEWLFDRYLAHGEDRRSVSPLFMPLPRRMPASLVITAGWCPLRDEGLAYVERLRGAGFEAEGLHFPAMAHAFVNLEDLVPGVCAEMYRAIGRFLRP